MFDIPGAQGGVFARGYGLLDSEEAGRVIAHLVAAARQWQPPELDGELTKEQFPSLFAGFMSPSMLEALWEFRKYVHRHPELALQERNTTQLVFAVLRAFGLEPRYILDDEKIGVICDIDPGQSPKKPQGQLADSGKWLVLRAELDALPLKDKTTTGYSSVLEGAAQACGHDAHLTIMLAVTLLLNLLNRAGILRRRVRFLGQPAEEVGKGAKLAVLAGAIKDASHVLAFHCEAERPAGEIGLLVGEITSTYNAFHLEVKGPGGHTGHPERTVDTIRVADEAALKMQNAVRRCVWHRYTPLVFGTANGGTASNVIPPVVGKTGTLRFRTERQRRRALAKLERVRRRLERKYPRAEVVLTIEPGLPATVNHKSTIRLVEKFAAVVGFKIRRAEQSGGGEDHSVYLLEVPGALVRLGVLPPGMAVCSPLHDGGFDVIQEVFVEIVPKGAELMSAIAVLG